MNEHTSPSTSESVEEAMSKAIEPVLRDRQAEAAPSLKERITGLAPPHPERTQSMAADRLIAAGQPIPMPGPLIAPLPAAPIVAQAMPAPIPRVPNRVYEHLVEGDDDVIGLIAYSLYKHDKRHWLMTWRAQHGVEAKPDQVEAFVNAQMTPGQRERYRTAARQVLDSYALVAVDMEKPQITREAVAGRVEAAARKVEASHRWWRQIPGVLIGAILSAGLLIGIVGRGGECRSLIRRRSSG
jgi:hypothetical protein